MPDMDTHAHDFGLGSVGAHHGRENVLQLGLVLAHGGHRGVNGGGNGRNQGRHSVQVVHATGVVQPQIGRHPGLETRINGVLLLFNMQIETKNILTSEQAIFLSPFKFK